MDIRQLRYFVSAVDVGSVTNAAHHLNISQPALGLQIRKLEEELGSPLLTRHSRGVATTPAGEKLYEHATLILRQTERAMQDIKGFAGPPSGRVSIGLTPTASLLLAASLVEKCRAELPNLAIRISDGHGDQNLALLSADRLDLALSYATEQNRDIEFVPLITEALFLISRPADETDPEKDVPFRALANAPLILPSRPNILSTLLEETAQSTQTALDIMYELDSMEPNCCNWRLAERGCWPRSCDAWCVALKILLSGVQGSRATEDQSEPGTGADVEIGSARGSADKNTNGRKQKKKSAKAGQRGSSGGSGPER